MRKRALDELAVYELGSETDFIEFGVIQALFIEKTSDIIYFTVDGTLYGIICMGDILHHMKDGMVPIMKRFTYMCEFQDDIARDTFAQKTNIQKIPVVKEGILIGDYSRWNDNEKAWIKWVVSQKTIWNRLKKYLKEKMYREVYVLNPVSSKEWIKKVVEEFFLSLKVNIVTIQKEDVTERIPELDDCLILTVDQDERRGLMCLEPNCASENKKFGLASFSMFYKILEQYDKMIRTMHYSIVAEGDQTENSFKALQKKGITVVSLYNGIYNMSDYIKKTVKKQNEYLKEYQLKSDEFWPVDSGVGKAFFAELLENEDYVSGFAQKEILNGHAKHKQKVSEYSSKYYNVIDGYRKTCYQPETCSAKIYMFGPCVIIGTYLEDKYTIASQLQKRICINGFNYQVINCGSYDNIFDAMHNIEFYEGDMILIWTGENTFSGIDSVDFRDVWEDNNVPAEWYMGTMSHTNHKMTELAADALYMKIKKYLHKKNTNILEEKRKVKIQIENYRDILGTYMRTTYIDRYFSAMEQNSNVVRGCLIVETNVDPTFYVHILQDIYTEVDELIVFIPKMNIDVSYSFEEYVLAMSSVDHGSNKIKLIPSERCVPYHNFFPFFYWQVDFSREQALADIKIFIQCIAEPLNIKYRFGVQIENRSLLSKQYGEFLSEELSKYGVKYIELM